MMGGVTTPAVTTFLYGAACYKNDFNPGDVCGAPTPTTSTYRGELVGYLSTTITHPTVDGNQLKEIHTFNTLTGSTAYQKWGQEAKVEYKNGNTALYEVVTTHTVSTSGLPLGAFFTYPSQVITKLGSGTLTQVNKVTYTYDTATGNLLSQTDYKGTSTTTYRSTNYSYQVNTTPSVWILDKLWKQTLTGGGVTSEVQFGYDGNLPNQGTITQGKLTLSRQVNTVPPQTVDTGYLYDLYGNMIETQVYQQYGATSSLPSGAFLSYITGYDNTLFTYPISSANPQFPANPELTSYDFALGLPISKTNVNGNTTTTDYDALGRIEAITYPGYAQPNMQYIYPTGVSITAPARIETQILDDTISGYRSMYQFYDGLGRLVETQTPYTTGATFSFTEYNAVGKVKSQSLPQQMTNSFGVFQLPTTAQETTTSYDALGRPTSITYPDSTTESFSYSYLTASHIDQNNHKTDQIKDEFGRLITVKEYTGSGTYTLYATTNYAYDVRDLLTTVTDAQSNVTTMTYDSFGRKTGMVDPNMGTWGYAYYPNGNLHVQTDARNCTVTMAYDNINRPVSKQYAGTGTCSGNPTVTYGYDSTSGGNEGIGQRTSMSDGSGSTSWFYNVLGQMTSETRNIDGNNYVSTFTYDAFGRPLTQGLPGNASETLNFSYNAMGALVGLSGTNTYVSNVTYNESGQVTDQTLGNGLRQQYCYQNTTQRVVSARTYPGGIKPCVLLDVPNTRSNFSYTYQNNGNISQLVDWVKDETINYTYDNMDRLTNASGPYNQTFTYNTTGNILTKSNPPSMTEISTGGNHTCSLTNTGGALCWGNDSFGQLGNDSSLTNQFLPVNVSGMTSGVSSISAGGSHTCALTTSGAVKCWGYNDWGQLGINSTVDKPTPNAVTGLSSGVISISAGVQHTCALTSTGAVKCWGQNGQGQLGDGTSTNKLVPVPVSGLSSGVIAISAGSNHTCALMTNNSVKCWGANSNGELGTGDFTASLVPVSVSGLSGAVAIDAGSGHTCALTSVGELKCWGYNMYGEIGDGTTIDRNIPTSVIGFGSNTLTFSVNSLNTCAVTTSGVVKCWGRNNQGQLGNGTRIDSNVPLTVSGLPTNITAVTTNSHTCILTDSGTVKCWGLSVHGQLGIGPAPEYQSKPVQVAGLTNSVNQITPGCALASAGMQCWGDNEYGAQGFPEEVDGLTSGIEEITDFNCAILSIDGSVKCWGNNTYGQLGDGTTTYRSTPVSVLGLSNVKKLVQSGPSVCALTETGAVKCWGYNSDGQLGDGTTTNRSTPVDVTNLNVNGGIVLDITAGQYSFYCALVDVQVTQEVKCWGRNEYGQLGDGTTTNRSTPVNVKAVGGSGNLSGVTLVDAGHTHACALLDTAKVVCWGDNTIGQLGNGTTTLSTTPVYVLLNGTTTHLTGVTDVQAGTTFTQRTCALTSSGGLKCWGSNGYGQLGDGTTTNRTKAVDVINSATNLKFTTLVSFEIGFFYGCAIDSTDALYCWGANSYGNIGDGTVVQKTKAVKITDGLADGVSSVAVSQDGYATCAITTTGAAKCWGSNPGDGTSSVRLYPVDVIFPTTVSTNYSYGSNKLSTKHDDTGFTNYDYDQNGNLRFSFFTSPSGTLNNLYTYNAENRLASVTMNIQGQGTGQTTQFIYDGDGNLVKQINPDGSKLIMIGEMYQEVRDASNVVTDWTVYYPAGGAMRVNGTLYYLLKDHLGSASVLTDSSGNVVDEQRYMPYGEPRLAGDDILTDRLFTGQRDIPSIDLMDYNARMYSPYLNHFTQPDSIVPDPTNPQDWNRYAYAQNNPLRYTDPTGHAYCDFIDNNNAEDCGGGLSRSQSSVSNGGRRGGGRSAGDMNRGNGNSSSGSGISGGLGSGTDMGHDYTVGPNPVCLDVSWINCTESEVDDYLRRWQYPGQWVGDPVINGEYYNVAPAYIFGFPTPLCYVGMCGSGAIQVEFNGATITNYTESTHIFNIGDVQRTRSQDVNGNYYVTTHGQGINDGYDLFGFVPIRGQTIDRANQAVGPIVFQAMDYGLLAYTTIIETGQYISTFLP